MFDRQRKENERAFTFNFIMRERSHLKQNKKKIALLLVSKINTNLLFIDSL